MSGTYCSVFGCNNTRKNTTNIKFYNFVKATHQKDRMKIWINFCRRSDLSGKDWIPTSNSRICSSHFATGKKSENPKDVNYYPTIRINEPSTMKNTELKVTRDERTKKRNERKEGTTSLVVLTDICEDAGQMGNPDLNDAVGQIILKFDACVQAGEMTPPLGALELFSSVLYNMDAETQVHHSDHPPDNNPKVVFVEREIQTDREPPGFFYGFDSVKNNEKKLKDLTSVSLNTFSLLLTILPKTIIRKGTLSNTNRLLLFLMKMKSGLTFLALGTLFNVSAQTASVTFYYVLDILEMRTVDWIKWPSRAAVASTMPASFKEHYPNCRIIIDCTEIKCETPSVIEQQNQMYSQYKSSYTVKYLIACNPNGNICFISKGYGGRSTDTYITTNSGILSKLEVGDLVLADKGFPSLDIKDGVIFVMPPFSSSKIKQFSQAQMTQTYTVASVRIHIERVIQRLKFFNIFTNRLSVDLLPHIDKLVHVGCILVNFQDFIIKAHDK